MTEEAKNPEETSGSKSFCSGLVSLEIIKDWTEGVRAGSPPEENRSYVQYRSYEISCNKCFVSVDIPPFLWGVDVVTIECSNCGNKWEQKRG